MNGGSLVIDAGGESKGWYKLLIPEIQKVFGGLFTEENILIPAVYARLGTEPVAFDSQLAVPMLFLERPVLIVKSLAVKADVPENAGMSALMPLIYVNRYEGVDEHENRCYIPAKYVTNIVPINSRCPLAKLLSDVTSEGRITIPNLTQVGKILDLSKN